MSYNVISESWNAIEADWLVIAIPEYENGEGFVESDSFNNFDDILKSQMAQMQKQGDLKGKLCQWTTLPAPSGFSAKRLLFLGTGKASNLTRSKLEKAVRTIARKTADKKNVKIAISLEELNCSELSLNELYSSTAKSFVVGSIGQDLYQKEPGHYSLDDIDFLISKKETKSDIEQAIAEGEILGCGINLTRQLVNGTAQDVYPESFAEEALNVAEEYGMECDILDEERLVEEKMQSMLAVAQGSDRPARMVVLKYQGASSDDPVLGLVGKGVTFDSGGLSLKPSDGMKTMKCDMAGAATVLGAMAAIASLKLPVNVTGFMGLAENMVSGASYKLGDVLKARNGITIEVLNTDAEGRLVLADVLSYAVDQKVSKLIDLATLTGACVVALGEEVTGVFSNQTEWAEEVKSAAKSCDESVWELPMFDEFAELLKSDVADVKNIGTRWGGATTAAKFLEKFTGGVPWVHLDIAGPAFASSNSDDREGGATGCMVTTLVEVAANFK